MLQNQFFPKFSQVFDFKTEQKSSRYWKLYMHRFDYYYVGRNKWRKFIVERVPFIEQITLLYT
jgi:hypothetical protein